MDQNTRFESRSVWNNYGAESASAQESRIAWIRAHIPSGVASILDVGCGNGLVTNRILDLCPKVVGCDLAAEPLKQVACETRQADATELPFPDRAFDLLMSLEMIEHLPDGARQKALAEMARVSRRWIILGVPNEENLLSWTARCPECRTSFHVWGHLASFSHGWLQQAFTQWGFGLEVVHLCGNRFAQTPRVLAWLRNHVFGMWYPGEKDFPCPRCGFDRFPVEETRTLVQKIFWRFERAVNTALDRTARPYWQIALFEKR